MHQAVFRNKLFFNLFLLKIFSDIYTIRQQPLKTMNFSVVTLLLTERERLVNEIKAIDTALAAIESFPTAENNGNSISMDIIKTQDESKERKPYEDLELEIPTVYGKDLTALEMLLYGLYKLNGATAIDAAGYVYNEDKSLDEKYLIRRFTELASALGRVNKLRIKKIGKRYKYFIPDEILQKTIEDIL